MFQRLLTVLLIILICTTGCGDLRDPTGNSPFQQEACDYVLLIAIDVSGSFGEYMAKDGKAYAFLQRALDKYFSDRIGSNDQIVLTQLSGNHPLLWQGTPQQLRREFSNQDAFRDYLISHADQNGSRLNDGVAESLDYVLHTYSVAQGKAKTIALILSDMLDNHPDQAASEQRLLDALTRYARRGACAFYFTDQYKMAQLRKQTEQAGFRWCIIEGTIHGNPPLPSFE